jgi:triosephosphate isomerase
MSRRPIALANWKMEMTVAESAAYLRRFRASCDRLLAHVQVILCPPFTALHPMSESLVGVPIELGAQTVSIASGGARTGEVSARLAKDAGARWALLGHWELRRQQGDTDQTVNVRVHRALEAGLRPILLVGEGREAGTAQVDEALDGQMALTLDGCSADNVARMVFVYEPEWTIGVAEPAPAESVGTGARFIRRWLAERYAESVAARVRILYGGSVSLPYARDLLALPDLDGLGVGRKGRDPRAFAELVHLIAQERSMG